MYSDVPADVGAFDGHTSSAPSEVTTDGIHLHREGDGRRFGRGKYDEVRFQLMMSKTQSLVTCKGSDGSRTSELLSSH